MRYMLLIYSNENIQLSDKEQQALYQEYGAFTQEVQANGVYEAGDPLHTTEAATTVRVREGASAQTDGPFAETKEQLGGYYILNCETLDEAIGYAAKIPTAKNGSIEVRPLLEM